MKQKLTLTVERSAVQAARRTARRQGTAAAGYTSEWKKAIVQLAEGERIELA